MYARPVASRVVSLGTGLIALTLAACLFAGGRAAAQPQPEFVQFALQFRELVEATRAELQAVQEQADQLARYNEGAGQMIERMGQDLSALEENGDRAERARVRRLMASYEQRLEGNRRLLESLSGQRARLSRILESLEAAFPSIDARLEMESWRREIQVRNERIAQIGRHADEMLGRYREWSSDARERPRENRAPRRTRTNPERRNAERQIEALKLALPALREAERMDAVEAIEYAVRAREMGLEGKQDEEFRRTRQRAPGREQIVKHLVMAEEIYREFGMGDRAQRLSALTEELWPKGRPDRQPRGEGDEAVRDLEVMRMAIPALKEAGRQDSAELVERAIRAREVRLEGRRDREAAEIREQAPTLPQQVELLAYAAELWQEFGHERKARDVGELAERMRSTLRREVPAAQVGQLERKLAEIQEALKEIKAELNAAERRRR